MPDANPAVETCLLSDTLSGSFKLGNQAVPINKRIRLQFGFKTDPDTYDSVVYPAANGQTLERTSLYVPGGLSGITAPDLLPWWIQQPLQAAIDSVNGVTATAELVGPVKFNFGSFLEAQGTIITLPLRVKLDNPFLGDSCYLGGSGDPLTLKLTTGTTTPPAGTAPMVGTPGVQSFQDFGQWTKQTGISLVDNNFRAPAAHGCGGSLFSWALDPVVGLKIGLPANPGVSQARLTGDATIASAAAVVASQ